MTKLACGARARLGSWALPLGLALSFAGGLGVVPGSVWAQEPPAVATPRPDSLRAQVLDRIRQLAAAPDTTTADSLGVVPAGAPGASLTAAPAQTAVPPGADALMRALLELDGFSAATYEGVRADFDVPARTLVLEGSADLDARFSGQGTELSADTAITYDGRDERIRTRGSTEFSREGGEPVTTRVLVYSLREDRGTALGAETTYREGGPWIVRGDLDSVQPGVLFGSTTRFTSCTLPEPHTSFQAARLKIVAGQMLVARSVTMYIEDVPVLWLPFIAQNLSTGRASGLLTPLFSVNDIVRTSSGYNRRLSNLGYYWAMSRYSDLTVAMDWFANSYTAVEARMGYRWARQFLGGSLNLKRFWGVGGRKDLAFSTQNSWDISERSALRASGRYISSSSFLRQNSFDPREATQTVDSDASLNRRFDWGTATFGASRKQYLNEDRTDLTLPSASLSLSTLTFFSASPQTARWYNNLSVSGSADATRRVADRPLQPDSKFIFSAASQLRTDAGARGSIGLGNFSLAGDLSTSQQVFHDVPHSMFLADPEGGDLRREDVAWAANLSYRLRLFGTTSVSPNVRISGTMLQLDSIAEARERVASPTRVSAGAGIQADVYGFYPGFGPFERVRHKMTPSLSWSYSPEVRPTARQIAVFGPRTLRRQSVLSFGFNQTWEARLTAEAAARSVPPTSPRGLTSADGLAIPRGTPAAAGDTVLVRPAALVETGPRADGGPTRLPPSRVVTLLSLQTTALSYDLVEADSTGQFLDGFTTTALSNMVGSDYLRGLRLSFSHDLFDDSARQTGGTRVFKPHLDQVAMNFSLNERSGIVMAIARFLGADSGLVLAQAAVDTTAAPAPMPAVQDDAYLRGPAGGQVIPTGGAGTVAPPRRIGWDAEVGYSLRRPRSSGEASLPTAQMLTANLSFAPTANWTVRWSTSYDVEFGRFNDHVVQLRRDLHEWEANFGFLQTPTGNWSFTFEVALRANQALHFDYDQRSLAGVQQAF
ncbi:MAG: LPS-assembly protein LptD [Gemmatimonadetes bacterium]|nr:LPS-assembly protein LptD [Gemmatimonadota bacterium]